MKSKVFTVCATVLLYCGAAHAGLSDGLVAYYPFNGNVNDGSGNGHNGILNGTPVLSSDRFGNANSAYSFSGTSDYIQLTNTSNIHFSTPSAISVWAKYTDINHGKGCIPEI